MPNDGSEDDTFGWSVAIENNIVAVGAIYGLGNNGNRSGVAYLFDADSGSQIAKIFPEDGAPSDDFGNSITIANGLVAVGSPFDAGDDFSRSGSVYIFNASTGGQVAKLLPPAGAMGSGFGSSVSIYNGFVLIGAGRSNENGAASGSAYLYDAYTCGLVAQFLPTDGAANDYFGSTVSFANGRIAVGAYRDDPNGAFSGSAYVFTMPNVTTPADLNGDGLVDFFDMQTFLNWYSAGDLRADFVPDGVLDFFDLQAYLNLFALGCV